MYFLPMRRSSGDRCRLELADSRAEAPREFISMLDSLCYAKAIHLPSPGWVELSVAGSSNTVERAAVIARIANKDVRHGVNRATLVG